MNITTRFHTSSLVKLSLAVSLSTLIIACSDSSDRPEGAVVVPPPVEPTITYKADIVWTEYGIPHVTADDWGGVGYGYGYAYAQHNYCVVMKEYVRAKGESARFLGDDGNISNDFTYKLFNDDERIERIFLDSAPQYLIDVADGYAAGLNRYLAETGVDNLAEGDEGCRGAEWVRDVDRYDVARLMHKAILRGSAGPLSRFTNAVVAPEQLAAVSSRPMSEARQLIAAISGTDIVEGIDMPKPEEFGSNAYAAGEQSSQSNAGVLLGNPHFPWQGPERFYVSHLTVTGEYDVMGSALSGLPLIVLGFNKDVAWSHTVSTAGRFTFYELELNPDNPFEYFYDDEIREITSQTVSAEQMADDGSVETVERTFYFSHFGPIVDLGTVSPLLAGWPNSVGTLLTYRDANLDNLRGIDQWVKMGQSTSLAEFKENLRPVGIPWVNTIAAGREGDAFYGDISATPNVSVAQYNSCIRGTLQGLLTDNGFLTMDGSDSDCEWGKDENTAEGVFGYDSLPKIETREYVANSNDSYWLSNPRMLLEGFSPMIGAEGIEQSMRTRQAFVQADEREAGTDGLGEAGFNVDNIRQMLFGSRSLPAELIMDDVVEICSAVEDWSAYASDATVAMTGEACGLLADWDRTSLVDSVGTHIFYQFWLALAGTDDLWAVPFDAIDPVNTPRDLNIEKANVVEGVKEALAKAVERLNDAGIAMNMPWGELQFDEKNGTRYPIHGASGGIGFSVITSDLVDGEGYSAIRHGNSYMQAVTWDETDCPDAYAIISYSQSTDPASDNYADSTELYSNSGWVDMPFCEAARDDQEVRRESIEE
jgi:acyl-homoserine-lactone acylase